MVKAAVLRQREPDLRLPVPCPSSDPMRLPGKDEAAYFCPHRVVLASSRVLIKKNISKRLPQ
jgi:hypothetical protein